MGKDKSEKKKKSEVVESEDVEMVEASVRAPTAIAGFSPSNAP
jgi:hypothetical protein